MELHDWPSHLAAVVHLLHRPMCFRSACKCYSARAFDAGDYLQEGDAGSQDSKPLHACWSALLQRILKADQTALVLRALDTASALAGSGPAHSVTALLTPHEAHQLVDTARSLTHKGE